MLNTRWGEERNIGSRYFYSQKSKKGRKNESSVQKGTSTRDTEKTSLIPRRRKVVVGILTVLWD